MESPQAVTGQMPQEFKDRKITRMPLIVAALIIGVVGTYLLFGVKAATGCDQIVSSVAAAQSAVSGAPAGTTVCMSAGSYGSITLSGTHSGNVTFQPDSSLDPNGAGKVTFNGINVNGSNITVRNFYSTRGLNFLAPANHDVADHNDITNGPGGYGLDISCNGAAQPCSFITMNGNRIHDLSSSGGDGDAIRLDGWSNVTITANEEYHIEQHPGSDQGHTDCLQSYNANVSTHDIVFDHNYQHDNQCQGFFLKDGDVSHNVTVTNNLLVRGNNLSGPDTNIFLVENTDNAIIRNNTTISAGGSVLEADGSGPAAATVDHNVFDQFNNLAPKYSLTENHNVFMDGNQWSFTVNSTDTPQTNARYTPAFACGSSCGNGTVAGDDYRLTTNPNGIGVDWSPSQYTYGPVNTAGSGTPPPAADTQAPGVSLTAPADKATVSGVTTTVSASASDDKGVVGVQFKLDGNNLGPEITTGAYSMTWNTTQASNGSHKLTAVARDAAGNSTTSSEVTVTVNNSTDTGGGGNKSCTKTLSMGTDVQTELSKAAPGAVICLKAGDWPKQTFKGIAPSGVVTLQPEPGALVRIDGIDIVGPGNTKNLTVQGFYIDGGVQGLCGIDGGVVFQYNTIQHINAGNAFYFYANSCGAGHVQTGISMLHNQMDHVGECVTVAGGDSIEKNFTFKDNVCGPDIGAGVTKGNQYSHYVEVGCLGGATVDNNAFLGPYDSKALANTDTATAVHNNVFHCFGDGSNISFSNNILWHTQSRAQTVLIQSGKMDNISLRNNLFVNDMFCHSDASNCPAQDIEIYPTHGLTVSNNTIVATSWGLHFPSVCTDGCYSGSSNYTLTNNIVESAGIDGNNDYSEWTCPSACTTSQNVSFDGSAPGSPSVKNWKPSYVTTNWTPNSGESYSAPPAGYYVATGLPFSAGWSGTGGPQGGVGAAAFTGVTPPPAADTTPPTVSFISPASGSNVSGIVTATVDPSDNVGVSKVEFSLDGTYKITATANPYSYSIDTKTLSNGTHTFSAKAYDASGNTSSVASLSVKVNNMDTTPPSAPTNLKASATSATNVNLSWSASTDGGANATGVTKYNVLRNGTVIAQVAGLTYADTTAVASTSYSYVVQALDGAGNVSPSSATANVTTPAGSAPSSDLLFNGTKLNQFLNQSAPGAVSQVADPLGSGQQIFKFVVKDSDVAPVTPTENPRAQLVGPDDINIGDDVWLQNKFLLPSDFPSNVPGWVALFANYGPPFGGSGAWGVELSGDQMQWQRNGTYGYDVPWSVPIVKNQWVTILVHEKFDANGFIEMWVNGQPVTFFTKNTTNYYNPKNVAPTTHLAMKTADASNNGGPNSGRVAQYRKVGMFPSLTTYHGPLIIGKTRSAVDAAAAADGGKDPSPPTPPTAPDTTPPTAPSNLAAAAASANQVNLSWGASTDKGGSGLAGYNVYRDGDKLNDKPVTTTSYGDSTLKPNTKYTYKVQAIDGAENVSGDSNTVSVTTAPAPDTAAPGKPRHVRATAVSAHHVTVSWRASKDAGGSAVAGYYIYRNHARLSQTTVTSTSFEDTSVQPGATYYYRLEAVDKAGNRSGQTDSVKVTTPRVAHSGHSGRPAASNGSATTSAAAQSPPAQSGSTNQTVSSGNSQVNVTVVGTQNQPLKGVVVSMNGRTARTDDHGVAHFSRLSAGKYNLAVSYNGRNTSQTVQVAGTATGQTFKVSVAKDRFNVALLLLPIALLTIAGGYFAKPWQRFSSVSVEQAAGQASHVVTSDRPDPRIVTPNASGDSQHPRSVYSPEDSKKPPQPPGTV